MSTPAITFAIPYHRGLHYLERAVASVVTQTRDDWTCTVVDDHGPEPEEAAALVAGFGDERIRYVRNERNLGLAGNWNHALRFAAAPLVTLLHSDDALRPGYADAVVRAHARHPGCTAVYTRARVVGPDDEPVFSFPDRIKRFIEPRRSGDVEVVGEAGLERLLRGQFIFCPALCYRVDALAPAPFTDRWRQVTDLAFLAETLLTGGTIVGIPDEVYDYRRHGDSETARLTASTHRFDEEIAIYDELAGRAEALGWYHAAATARRKRIIRLHLSYRITGDLLHGRLGAARAKRVALRRSRQS